jgi:hypothetical protein
MMIWSLSVHWRIATEMSGSHLLSPAEVATWAGSSLVGSESPGQVPHA